MVGCAYHVLAGRLLSLSIITWLRCPVRLPLRVRMWLSLYHRLRLGTAARTVLPNPALYGAYMGGAHRVGRDAYPVCAVSVWYRRT